MLSWVSMLLINDLNIFNSESLGCYRDTVAAHIIDPRAHLICHVSPSSPISYARLR